MKENVMSSLGKVDKEREKNCIKFIIKALKEENEYICSFDPSEEGKKKLNAKGIQVEQVIVEREGFLVDHSYKVIVNRFSYIN